MFQTKVVEKNESHVVPNILFHNFQSYKTSFIYLVDHLTLPPQITLIIHCIRKYFRQNSHGFKGNMVCEADYLYHVFLMRY
jgi:hypothetical protein